MLNIQGFFLIFVFYSTGSLVTLTNNVKNHVSQFKLIWILEFSNLGPD